MRSLKYRPKTLTLARSQIKRKWMVARVQSLETVTVHHIEYTSAVAIFE